MSDELGIPDVDDPAPSVITIGGNQVRKGSTVRLRPRGGADVFDLALVGRTGTVDALEQDMEGKLHLAVRVDGDPGHDLSARIGERFFFGVDEVEPLPDQPGLDTGRVLVAGLGNVFFGDDGFGVEVANTLRARTVPARVDVVDFGIRGMDLVYALGSGYRSAVLVDAAPRGSEPGTVSLIEPRLEETVASLDAHRMDPVAALRQARQFGPLPDRVLLVVCEPSTPATPDPDDEDMAMQLSPPVRAGVHQAVEMLDRLLGELTEQEGEAR